MKKYVMYREVTETSALVTAVIFSPEKSQESKDGKGFYTDEEVPVPNPINNQISTLMITLPDRKFYYDYTEAPPTLQQQVKALQEADKSNKEAISFLTDMILNTTNV